MIARLLLCPFCSCAAIIGEVHERDDRRYMSVRVDCSNCDAFQRASIPYNEFSKMSDSEINIRLTKEASELWNRRDDLATAAVNSYGKLPDPLAAAEGDLLADALEMIRMFLEYGSHACGVQEDARALIARATRKEEA